MLIRTSGPSGHGPFHSGFDAGLCRHNDADSANQTTPVLSCQSSGTDGCRTKTFLHRQSSQVKQRLHHRAVSQSPLCTGRKQKGTAPRWRSHSQFHTSHGRPLTSPNPIFCCSAAARAAATVASRFRTASGRAATGRHDWFGFQAFLLVSAAAARSASSSSPPPPFLCRVLDFW